MHPPPRGRGERDPDPVLETVMSDERHVIFYADGGQVHPGDRVDFDGDPATVTEILATPEQLAQAGMGEAKPVVGFMTSSLGEVFQSPADRGWDGVRLLRRGG
jgi:hypothetical protein